jgi:hypothetical protein
MDGRGRLEPHDRSSRTNDFLDWTGKVRTHERESWLPLAELDDLEGVRPVDEGGKALFYVSLTSQASGAVSSTQHGEWRQEILSATVPPQHQAILPAGPDNPGAGRRLNHINLAIVVNANLHGHYLQHRGCEARKYMPGS